MALTFPILSIILSFNHCSFFSFQFIPCRGAGYACIPERNANQSPIMAKFRTPFDDPYPEDHRFYCDPESGMAIQSEKDSCDINNIVDRIARNGILPTDINPRTPVYDELGAYVDLVDMQTNLNRMIEAEEAFMALPSATRKLFDNNALELLRAIDEGDDRVYQCGLAKKPEKVNVEGAIPASLDVKGIGDTNSKKEGEK